MNVESMPLTKEQIATMTGEPADWLMLTPEQEDFMRTNAPGEVFMFYGGSILKLHEDRLGMIMKVAFQAACRAALEMLDSPANDSVQIKCSVQVPGQTFVHVTATDARGKQASAIGMIPDPRGH
jgi:hypothetical protein